MSDTFKTDIVVVGAGPVGLFQIFEAGMLDMRCHVVDTLEAVGGQCTALYPEKPIYDIPGYPSIMAEDLVDKLAEQAAPFDPVYHLDQQVVSLARDGEDWRVETSKGVVITCRAVVIAAGCGSFGPNRPPLAGVEAYEGSGSVAYYVTRREVYRGKKIVIAGGGDSAVDWVLSLAEVADKLMVVHRRPKFRAAPDSVNRMNKLAEDGAIEMVVPYQLHGLDGSDGKLDAVIVADLDGNERRLDADVLLPFYGLRMELGPIADWGLNLDRNLITTDPATSATSEPGIYAIGDIVTYPGKLKLILSGFSEAAMAAHAIRPLVYPDEELHFEYSTTKGLPGAD
ncbi:MAG: NAD(P)/FAD-dependent oxidoreductase [Pseudomonadota bacterium]